MVKILERSLLLYNKFHAFGTFLTAYYVMNFMFINVKIYLAYISFVHVAPEGGPFAHIALGGSHFDHSLSGQLLLSCFNPFTSKAECK